jgi:adenine-specific DNA-methyltransferase
MLNLAVRNTGKLIRQKSKSENVRLGRLFTKKDTARLMAGMLNIDGGKTAFTVLDPGAGTGILSAAVIEEICKRAPSCKQIFLTCYETCGDFLPMLEDNLERIRKKCRHDYGVKLYSTVYDENYIVDSKKHYTVTFFDTVEDKYDIIISNPPKELVEKGSLEADSAGGVTQLKIGAEMLFLQTSARHLEDDGQLVTMLPTTYATASQIGALRKSINESLTVNKIHLFVGKQKNLSRAVPLKKEFIMAFTKNADKNDITVSTSSDSGKTVQTLPPLAYGLIVNKDTGVLSLPKTDEEARIVKYISGFPETLSSIGLKMSTGLIVDSKCDGLLFTEPTASTVPLLRSQTIVGGTVSFPQPIKRQYIAPIQPSLMQKNKNLVLIKRIPAKSDERLLNSAVYLAAQLPKYRYISTHNKINFIDTKNKDEEMSARLTYGIFALLNSTIYDRYISITSKSKQINSKEMRTLPLPPKNIIENIGMRLMATRQTTVKACDMIVNPTLHIREK